MAEYKAQVQREKLEAEQAKKREEESSKTAG
jgi:hypothetical protein